jgi:hypothetical protein
MTLPHVTWAQVFGAWVVLNMVASPVASKVSPTTWYGKILHVFVAISPADVSKAIKVLGSSAVPPVAGAVALLVLLSGCSGVSAVTVAAQQAEVAAYGADQIQCVSLADTRAQADSCIAAVKARWCGDGGALREAGACSYDTTTVALDGGTK